MTRSSLALAALAALAPLALAAPALAQYKILRTEKIGGEGGWDYVGADPANRTLYVARSGPAGHIGVYSIDTLKQVGDIPGVSAHGAAVDDATGHGFATSKPITMFDAKTFAIIKKIDVQGNPDGYINDPQTHRFYVLSHSAPNITVLDDKDGTILGTIDLGGAPEEAALDGKGKMYVDLEDKDAIGIVDLASMKKIGQYDISSHGGGCAGLAIDRKNGILFAACRDKQNMIILSATDGHILTDLPTGRGVDGTVFNPNTMEAIATAGDGHMTVIKEASPTSFSVEQNLDIPERARTLTIDPRTGHIFSLTAQFGPAPAAATPAGGPPARGMRAPMIPGSFEIIEIGK
jgi:DNA-binding beta-propeller fold protein YncE